MMGMMQRRDPAADRFAFATPAANATPAAGPELAPTATLAGLVGDDGSRQLIDLVKLLTDMQRKQQDDARGRQFGGVGGFNDAQRQMTMALRDPASRASAISGYSAANRRAALRAAGIDPDAPGATNVAWQGKTPEQYAADVKRSIDAAEARRVAAADRLREKTAQQRAARQAAQLPAVDGAVNPADPLDDLAQQLAKMQYA
jgi:hypothetical protein